VEITVDGQSLRAGASRELFVAPMRLQDYSYDLAPDGERFLISMQGTGTRTSLVLVSGWEASL
jgi:hypothetical protein